MGGERGKGEGRILESYPSLPYLPADDRAVPPSVSRSYRYETPVDWLLSVKSQFIPITTRDVSQLPSLPGALVNLLPTSPS